MPQGRVGRRHRRRHRQCARPRRRTGDGARPDRGARAQTRRARDRGGRGCARRSAGARSKGRAGGRGGARANPLPACPRADRGAVGSRGCGARGRRPSGATDRTAHRGRDRDLRAGRGRRTVMTIHFIGAGPGAADLITVRGRDLLGRCPVCLYAGSIVPPELLAWCPPGAKVVDTAPMTLDAIEALYVSAHGAGHDVARLHSGDLSVFSAVAEQIRRLERRAIPYTLTPGVPAFAAAAAVLGRELTVPEIAQSVVLTRVPGRASPMPAGERLDAFAATGATLVLHLAIQAIDRVVAELTPRYGEDCPVAVVARATWPDERIVRGTLADIRTKLAAEPIERTAVILVGPALTAQDFRESALYDPSYRRRFRGEERP